ncbi:hypothetical protein H7X87_04475, partial [Acetobacteraceae bacterium]|nr:hypothetical protein [Candidatus Parcubacteria bacterium]
MTTFVERLVCGQNEIDRMRKEIDMVVRMLCGLIVPLTEGIEYVDVPGREEDLVLARSFQQQEDVTPLWEMEVFRSRGGKFR